MPRLKRKVAVVTGASRGAGRGIVGIPFRCDHTVDAEVEALFKKVDGLQMTESTEFIGRAVVALTTDSEVMEKSGRLLEVADLAREYGLSDVDGRQVPPFRELFPELFQD